MTRQVTEYFGQQPDGTYSTRGVHSWPNEPLKKELEAFVHAIRTGEPPPSPARTACATSKWR